MRHEQLSAALKPDTADAKNRTIDLAWYTGEAVKRYDFWTDEEYLLRFSMDPADVKLDRLSSGRAPLINSHGGFFGPTLADQIGVVEKAWLDGGTGYATVRFSERADVEPIWQDVKGGIIRNVSMGANIDQTRDITEKGQKTKTILAIDWTPWEISAVPIGADPGAAFLSATQSFPHFRGMRIAAFDPAALSKIWQVSSEEFAAAKPAPAEKQPDGRLLLALALNLNERERSQRR